MIYITNTLRISKLDDKCLQIEEYKDVVSKRHGTAAKKWCRVGYYGDVRSALVGALKKQLFDTVNEELQLKDLIERIDIAVKSIENIKFEKKL